MKTRHQFEIVQMAEHFLYAPLYYAYANSFFGQLPRGYSLKLNTVRPKTDEHAYRQLMDVSSDQARNAVFAVCDPTVILTVDPHSDASPVVLARVVTNAAFWAVDHRSRTIKLLRDLGEFDKVIAFHPGSTSYAIAQRVFREAGRKPEIFCVEPKQELTKLAQSPTSWTALSPDLLEIEHLISKDTRFAIDLALGKTPEYNDVLVTALLSRDDVIREHRDLVIGLLRALQLALLTVNCHDIGVSRRVTDWASRRFQEPRDVVDRALRKAREAQLFPSTIEINEPDWLNAARTVPEAIGKDFDPASATKAKEQFDKLVSPYRSLAIEAMGATVVPSTAHRLKPLGFVSIGLAVGIIAALLVKSTGWFTHVASGLYLPAMVIIGLAAAIPHVMKRTRHEKMLLISNWLLLSPIACAVTLWNLSQLKGADAIAIAAAFAGPLVAFWVERLSRLAEE